MLIIVVVVIAVIILVIVVKLVVRISSNEPNDVGVEHRNCSSS